MCCPLDQLLAFYDYPCEHWVHLRTTNPIESTFATVRHRSKITKGPGSRAAGLAMAFNLIESARTAGVRSTHPTSSRSSAPVSATRRESWSNDPTITLHPRPPYLYRVMMQDGPGLGIAARELLCLGVAESAPCP